MSAARKPARTSESSSSETPARQSNPLPQEKESFTTSAALVVHQPAGESLALAAMDPAELVAQVKLIQQVMRDVMKPGEHYGVIPGTSRKVKDPVTGEEKETTKPTLLKPGAEKLGFLFRLVPEFEIKRYEYDGGHREYELKCRLIQVHTGRCFGEGVGTCTTLESRYRYRSEAVLDANGQPRLVPQTYWKTRNPAQLGGATFKAKKRDGRWVVVHQVENPDIADTYNSVLKISKKRSHVDAVMTATAASDVFSQDLEDIGSAGEGASDGDPGDGAEKKKAPAGRKPLPKRKTSAKSEPPKEEPARQTITGLVENPRTSEFKDKTYWFIDIGEDKLMTAEPALGEDLHAAAGNLIEAECVNRVEKGPNHFRVLSFNFVGEEVADDQA